MKRKEERMVALRRYWEDSATEGMNNYNVRHVAASVLAQMLFG